MNLLLHLDLGRAEDVVGGKLLDLYDVVSGLGGIRLVSPARLERASSGVRPAGNFAIPPSTTTAASGRSVFRFMPESLPETVCDCTTSRRGSEIPNRRGRSETGRPNQRAAARAWAMIARGTLDVLTSAPHALTVS